MGYELLNNRSGNWVGQYASEREALAYVLALVQQNGRADHLTLGYEGSDGRTREIASGEALVERALIASSGLPDTRDSAGRFLKRNDSPRATARATSRPARNGKAVDRSSSAKETDRS